MGFFDLFRPKYKQGKNGIAECFEAYGKNGLEYNLRKLAFDGCVNLIANKIALCKMKEFVRNKEVEGSEYRLWNLEPNRNQNASQFWHKIIYNLYNDGEALIIDEPYGTGIVVADSFVVDETKPTTVYRSIQVGNRTIEQKTEPHVMHLVLNNEKVAPLIQNMADLYLKLLDTAERHYRFNSGQHWKMITDTTVNASPDWIKAYNEMFDKSLKPFLESSDSFLPQPNGYKFEQISGAGSYSTQEVRDIYKAIWQETAKALNIPGVLIDGTIADTSKATDRLLTDVIDPIATQITQEANRKRYTAEDYQNGDYVLFDTSTISHYDLLANAANVEKLAGAGLWSINELRTKLGDTPLTEEWADKHFLTKNIGTVEETTENEEES